MFLLPFSFFVLKCALYVSPTSLSKAESLGRLILSLPSANSTHLSSTISDTRLLTRPDNPIPFPIENSTITLLIYDGPARRIGKTAVRNIIFDAYTFVSNLIDIAGDGDLPPSSDPYEVETNHAYIRIISDNKGPGKLKWSNLKDVLLGLREYMVVQGHLFQVAFVITQGEGAEVLGFGRLLGEPPTESTN